MKIVYFEDLAEGSVIWSDDEVIVDRDEMVEYARKNDPWPFHIDEEAAKKTPFGGLIASVGYTISLYLRLVTTINNTPEVRWAFLGAFDVRASCPRPVRPGDELRLKTTIESKRLSSKPGRGIVNSVSLLVNQTGEEVFRWEVAYLVATRPSSSL